MTHVRAVMVLAISNNGGRRNRCAISAATLSLFARGADGPPWPALRSSLASGLQQIVTNIISRIVVASVALIVCAAVAVAEPTSTANLLRDLPPDDLAKIAELAQLFSDAIRNGQLTDAQIKATLNTGDVEALIRTLGPDAARLLQDITTGLKANYSDEQLHQLLGGLTDIK
jgi:hypothetical protein